MFLAEFAVLGWRNLKPTRITPGPALNVIFGDNAQGKTNFLEAIYYLATLRSFRRGRLADFISWDGDGCRVWARTEVAGRIAQLEVKVSRSSRTLLVDGASVSSVEDYFGGFNVVLFTPDHLRLVHGEPALRRRFLDRSLFNVDPAHLQIVRRYQRVLRERNAVIRDWDRSTAAERAVIDALDEQLASAGWELVLKRTRAVEALSERFFEIHHELAGRVKSLELSYHHRGLGDSELVSEESLLDAIRESRQQDLRRGYSGVGPHQDDLRLFIDGRLAREAASQGETRTIVLALKIAEVLWITRERGEPPVLLLDDISSELDDHRRGVLFQTIDGLGSQAFVTTVSRDTIPSDLGSTYNRVREGALDSVK